jgi:lysozyme family protein
MRYSAKWPQYASEWDRMAINRSRETEFTNLAQFAVNHKTAYTEVENATKVPWTLVAVLHRRESDANFNTYLGNGDPLSRRTTHVPRGRGPFSTFLAGAIDALKLDGLSSVVPPWPIEKILWWCESFNGWGYSDYHGIPSPYNWGGTNIQARGKYVSDGQWDPSAWDSQPGCAPILQEIAKLDLTVVYTRET